MVISILAFRLDKSAVRHNVSGVISVERSPIPAAASAAEIIATPVSG
jgi:hypothetical protein